MSGRGGVCVLVGGGFGVFLLKNWARLDGRFFIGPNLICSVMTRGSHVTLVDSLPCFCLVFLPRESLDPQVIKGHHFSNSLFFLFVAYFITVL